MADVLTHIDTLDVEVAPQEELDVTVGSPMEHSRLLSITKNGKYVVSEYDLADVNVAGGEFSIEDADYWPSGGKNALTGVVIDDENYKIECEWSWNTFNTQYSMVYGSYSSTSRTVLEVPSDFNYDFAFAYNTLIGTSVTRIGVTGVLGKKYKSILTSKGLDLDGTFYELANKVFDTKHTTPLYIGSNYNNAGDFNLYSLKIYHNDVLVLDLVPQKIDIVTTIYCLYDNVSKKILNNSFRLDDASEISTLSLDYDEPSDFQTLTLSNEEYQAVKPVLAKIRGEEIVDDEPRAVVE